MKMINYLKLFTPKQLEELARRVVKYPTSSSSTKIAILQTYDEKRSI